MGVLSAIPHSVNKSKVILTILLVILTFLSLMLILYMPHNSADDTRQVLIILYGTDACHAMTCDRYFIVGNNDLV
jgi:hypothetical protein